VVLREADKADINSLLCLKDAFNDIFAEYIYNINFRTINELF
jgi:hypothetical protein